ncbi:hypothetical protein [Arthrobacter gengyunqii]|uniref:Uncharacterized protein n=1 Tax=Arthrobacter gengyunqii TaxID=2886940 RepID=A0ABS8GK67_9MICC|nr:hypothetical protein [Arthrobacter gengyunqii]MCC3266856.1 hypothetical protein [Arthrobacter gengyunqii]
MPISLISWLVAGVLAVTCLAVARSAWNLGERAPGISRMALLSGLLDAAATAALFRLALPWSAGTTLLWVLAMAALAVAVAGAVIRWPELPSHAGLLDFEESGPGTTESGSPEPGSGGTLRTKPSRKAKKKSTKKEPGRTAVAVRAGVLAAVVVLSFAVG